LSRNADRIDPGQPEIGERFRPAGSVRSQPQQCGVVEALATSTIMKNDEMQLAPPVGVGVQQRGDQPSAGARSAA
jgi:hypothetical protein